jgi:hypothetical protein
LWFATPSTYETFIHYTLPIFTGARAIAFGFLIAGRNSFERARLHSAVPKLGEKNGPALAAEGCSWDENPSLGALSPKKFIGVRLRHG